MEVNKLVPMLYNEKEVRVIRTTDGSMVFPLPDIARAIGYDRQPLHNMIRRAPDLFEGEAVIVTMTPRSMNTRGQRITALTQKGVILLIGSIAVTRIKDPEKRKNLVIFKRWVAGIIDGILDGSIKFIDPRYVSTVYVETGKSLAKDMEWFKQLVALPLYSKDSRAQIKAFADAEGVQVGTVYNYIRRYQEGGEVALQRQPPNRPDNEFCRIRGRIRQWVQEHPDIRAFELWERHYSDYSLGVIRKIVREARAEIAAGFDVWIDARNK
jgi:transposase